MNTLIVVLSLWVAVGALLVSAAIRAGKVCLDDLPFAGLENKELGGAVFLVLTALLWPYSLWKSWDRQDENQQK